MHLDTLDIQTAKQLGVIMLITVSHKRFSDRVTDRLRNSPQTKAELASNTSSTPISGGCSDAEGRHWQMEMGAKAMMSCWLTCGNRSSHSCSPGSSWFWDV